MRFGLLSDNHGHLAGVHAALAAFETHDIQGVIHCGDIGTLDTLELLGRHPYWFVWGNTDLPAPTWKPVVEATNGHWPTAVPTTIDAGEKQIAVFHGHEPGFADACYCPTFDYILHGHTHRIRDERHRGCRIINPGALHRTPSKSVAVLDVDCDELLFINL